MNMFLSNVFKFLSEAEGEKVVSPLYDGITLIGPYAIGVCLVLSTLWGIFLGVRYARAEDPGEKENLHKVLVNYCIGAISVVILIAIIYAIREPLVMYIEAG